MEDCVPDPSGDWTYICDDGSEETSGGGRAKFWSEKCTLVEPEEGNSCPVPQSWHDKFLGIFTTEKFQTKVQAIVNMLELDTAREEERQRYARQIATAPHELLSPFCSLWLQSFVANLRNHSFDSALMNHSFDSELIRFESHQF